MGVEDLEGVTGAEMEDASMEDVEVVLVETPLEPEPIIDWLWKTCLHVLH